jgi:hypothetical protein
MTNELIVADGHGNRRVIVFDGATGVFKRMWGSRGRDPDDPAIYREDPAKWGIVHSVALSDDRLLYVGDRSGGFIEVFHLNGTFVSEVAIEPEFNHLSSFNGPWGIAFSHDPEQRHLFVTNGITGHVLIMDRKSLRVLSKFGSKNSSRPLTPGQFMLVHSIAVDASGSLYITETGGMGARVQKFLRI